MFFHRFKLLCDEQGISIYKAATSIGLNRAAANKWKNGSVPNGQTLTKLAAFFNVSNDYLLGNADDRASAAYPDSPSPAKDDCNLVRIAARDGSYRERYLTDDQLAALTAILDQMPDVPDDL